MGKTFQEFLKEKAHDEGVVARRERRQEWLEAVGRLLAQLQNWLREADPDAVLCVESVPVDRNETGLGSYRTEGLNIFFKEDAAVQVVPVARNVAGFLAGGRRAEGRVDITNGLDKHVLYRTLADGVEHWYVFARDGHAGTPFDRNQFESILQDLLS
jgi:hypothetical protein